MTDEGLQVSVRVRSLYDDIGWKEVDGVTYDARTGEDLRSVSQSYITATRRRVLNHLPTTGDKLLDMASGPIQYPEYLEFSAGFERRVCVDLSQRALDMARVKIGDHGEYLCGDFLDLPIEANSMDAVISLHTVYHIHASRQAAVVRKLIDVVRQGGNVVVVYSNPNNFVSTIMRPLRRLAGKSGNKDGSSPEAIYFDPQPLAWWKQFSDAAEVEIYPWRTLSTTVQKVIIPPGAPGRWMLSVLFKLENALPALFVRLGVYPMIVLKKR